MRAVVVGAGLGGLLTACALAERGFRVRVHESLPYPGGRFTNLEFRGFQLSTGALHMIPHGRRGPLAEMLAELGAGVEIFRSEPQAVFRIGGRDYGVDEVYSAFSTGEKLRAMKLLAMMKLGRARAGDESYAEWLERHLRSELVMRLADAFTGWCLSLRAHQVPAAEVLAQVENLARLGETGVPDGGCRGVVEALVEVLESNGGELRLRSRVLGVSGTPWSFRVHTGEGAEEAEVVVCNAGLHRSAELAEAVLPPEYVRMLRGVESVPGVKISVACDEPVLGHSGVVFTPDAERVCGMNEVTNAVPELAPPGKHLLMAHAAPAGGDLRREAEIALRDLHRLIPDFRKRCRVLAVQTYRGEWPVNHAPSGTHIPPETPAGGLYLVGDGVKPRGWMETDGIAMGVRGMLEHLSRALEESSV